MNPIYRDRLQKKQIWTIPNCMSYFRILLIPLIVLLYCVWDKRIWAAALVLLSGITDVVDGKIARRFNMISDFGKFIDPVADKLTQAALLICLVVKQYYEVLVLVVMMAIKEVMQFFLGLLVLRRENRMESAQWFGKVNTVFLYAVIIALFLFPEMPKYVVGILVVISAILMLASFAGYLVFYRKQLSHPDTPKTE